MVKGRISGIIEQLVTRDGDMYLGILVAEEILQPYLDQLHHHIGDVSMARYAANRKMRDGSYYHITVVNPVEYEQLFAADTAVPYGGDPLEYELVGLGYVRDSGDTTFYVICESEAVQQLRGELGLGRKDLHVTLGFDGADVHGVVKDLTTLIDIECQSGQF